MESLFNIENFNIIEDEENYYFFRALNMEDNNDLEALTILDEKGNINKLRTDRERYENNHENNEPKYNKDSEISLEQVYDHIKMNHRKDTNCISLSSNANVSISYGRGSYKDKYVIVKSPKREFGEKVINAGQYMLKEIKKKVDEYSLTKNLDSKIKDTLNKIDKAQTLEEIRNAIQTTYTSKEKINLSRSKVKKGISYKTPHTRISSYQALSEEQSLEKNKIVAKLTILERRGEMKPIIPHTSNNNLLVQTIGNAFSSLELIHYGDIQKNEIINVPKEIVDIFALMQQLEGQDKQIIKDIEKDILQFMQNGNNIEILKNSNHLRNDSKKENISIEEIYELTNGKVEYGIAKSIVKNMFYLAKSQLNARELAGLLRKITDDNPRYEKIIKYIEKNGFEIQPEILTRQSNKGYKISESVNLNLKPNEFELVEQIKDLTDKEQIEILENGGVSNVRNIMISNFADVQTQKQIAKDEYYAEAIFSLYNWQGIGIEGFTIEEKNNLLKKIKDEHCVDLYKMLENQGISQNEISTILLNIITRKADFEVKEGDTPESIKEKRLEQYNKLISNNLEDLKQELSIERLERFLGYYDVKGTGIQLRSYQQRADEKTDEIFEKERFASVILPTGGGKSFVAISQLMKHKDEEILYLAPQNEILEQMKDYIIKYIHGPVNTIGRTKDEIISDIFPNINFCTYAGLLSKDAKETIDKKYGFIVLDELHRTGAKEWGEKLNNLLDNQDKTTKVFGITATPRRDVDGKNMANEIAERLGYTNRDAVNGKHIAMNMSLINAIRMGLVVNPKLVSCEYSLKTDGSLDELKEKIDYIEDEKEKNEKLEKYNNLRKKLNSAKGISEILQENVKKGGKYIVFLPIIDQIEDEDGNVIGRMKSKDKIQEYEKQIAEYFKDSNIKPRFHSMLGEYGDKQNKKRLEEFQNANTDCTELMLVMNKANEGLHIDKLDGIIWLRPLDENSRILYLQQLGRVIYSEDLDNPTKDEDRPIVIDLVNNTLKVNWRNEITEQDDIEILNIIVDWAEKHDNTLPDINSTDREEVGYATALKEIKNKYKQYLENEFEDLNEKQIEEIQEILRLGYLIDLWQIELPSKIVKNRENHNEKNFDSNNDNINDNIFELTGVLKDFVDINDSISETNTIDCFINILIKLKSLGVDVSKITKSDTIETLAEKSGISKDILKKNNIDSSIPIGRKKANIASAYRGIGEYKKPEKEQVKKLLELGINLEKRDTIQEFIELLKKLKDIGVDVSKITSTDTIETLAEKSGIGKDILKKNNIDSSIPIGSKKAEILKSHRGKGEYRKPEKEQVKELFELGINLEKRDIVQEFINLLKELKDIGVNVSKITDRDTIETLAKKSGIGEDILKKNNIDSSIPIGSKKSYIVNSYRGIVKGIKPKKEQVKELLKLRIKLDKKDTIQEFINILKELKNIGVDVSKITKTDTIETLAEKSGIGKDVLEEANIDPNILIGSKKANIMNAYRGKGSCKKPKEEQVKELLELGISLEKKKGIKGKEIAEASISAIQDIERADKENEALKELIKKSKEGGIKINEQS